MEGGVPGEREGSWRMGPLPRRKVGLDMLEDLGDQLFREEGIKSDGH